MASGAASIGPNDGRSASARSTLISPTFKAPSCTRAAAAASTGWGSLSRPAVRRTSTEEITRSVSTVAPPSSRIRRPAPFSSMATTLDSSAIRPPAASRASTSAVTRAADPPRGRPGAVPWEAGRRRASGPVPGMNDGTCECAPYMATALIRCGSSRCSASTASAEATTIRIRSSPPGSRCERGGQPGERRGRLEPVEQGVERRPRLHQAAVAVDVTGRRQGTGDLLLVDRERQGRTVAEGGADADATTVVGEPVLGETQLVGDVEDHGVVDGSPLEVVAAVEALGPDATPGLGVGLEDEDVEAVAGEHDGGDQAVVAGTDDDYVVAIHEKPLSTSPEATASSTASGRHRSICSRSSRRVSVPSATSWAPSTHTSLTVRGEAAYTSCW